MHPPTQRTCLAAALGLAVLAPAVAHADRTPSPAQIEARTEEVKPPPSPDAPPPSPSDPLAGETKAAVKAETKVEATRTDAARDAKKTEAGGMCRAVTPSGGWELLVLLALGLRARRRGR